MGQVSVINSLIEDNKITSRKSVASMAALDLREENKCLLKEIEGKTPTSPINGYESLVNFAPTSSQPIHRWFWYREGYSQELVAEFIKPLPKGAVVMDPFCGAGTTLLAARELGYPSIGIDVNPISTLVSKVKTTTLTNEDIAAIKAGLNEIQRSNIGDSKDPIPELKIIDKVYDSGILDSLLIIRKIINKQANKSARDFLFVAWLSILESVSNVYKEGNGIKYKNRKRTNEGYIRVELSAWAEATFPPDRLNFVKLAIAEKVHAMLEDIVFMPAKGAPVSIYESSATEIDKNVEPNSVALAIFSPPYCNCFNYFKMYKVELWMGGFVNKYEELRELNRSGLRSHVETVLKKPNDIACEEIEPYASLLEKTELWDDRIPDAVRGYFIDMTEVLRGVHTVLKPSARCVIVVGNSAYGGIVIPTDSILAKIGERLGFKVEKIAVARHLTTSSQQRAYLEDRIEFLRESIVVLSKEDPRLVDKELQTVEEIPIEDAERRDSVFLIKNSGLTAGTHKFHRYPGKFIPHIPRWALKRYAEPGAKILDPFCGSGTTLVEAMIAGFDVTGIDVDPIARLVSSVKTTRISEMKISELLEDVTRELKSRKIAQFRPTIETLNHWFTPDAVTQLGIVRDVIDLHKTKPEEYNFLLICFASIIRRASNADNQTQKTYVSHTKPKTPEPAIPLFLKAIGEYGRRVTELPDEGSAGQVAILGNVDARNFAEYFSQKQEKLFDLVITSPPYLNSVDYVYNQMGEYFWIGDLFDLQNQALQNAHKKNYIGTTQWLARDYAVPTVTGFKAIDALVERIRNKSPKNAHIVAKYFQDMALHFVQSNLCLRKGGHYISVVGDSVVSGEPILVHELLVEIASRSGLKLINRFGYEIRNRHMRFPRMGRGGIVRYDWILEFEKT